MPTDSRQCLKQSQWQKKYKNRTSTLKATAKMSSPSRRRLLQFQDALDHDKIGNDDASVGAWINLIQRRADEEAATKATLPELSCGFPIPDDRLPPTDDEVGAVIAEMERLLSGRTTAPTNPLEYSFLHDDPSIDDSSTNSCTNNNKPRNLPPKHYSLSISSGEQSFSGDHVALVFRRTKGEVIKKKCLTALSQHCQKEKRRLRWIAKLVAKSQRGKILGGVYMNWKHHVRMMKVKESLLACKIGRVLSKKFRRSFAAWKQMTLDRKEIEDLLIERFRQKNLRRIVVDWSKRNRETKALSETTQQAFVLRTKAKTLSTWRIFSQEKKVIRNKKLGKAIQFHRLRIIRLRFTSWSAMRAVNGVCTQSDGDDSQFSTPNVVERERSKRDMTNCEPVDRENQQPNSSDNNLLRPIHRKKPIRSTCTPQLVIAMKQRHEEREKRREILRSRYEHLAKVRKQRLEEERIRKENEELKVHQEYMQQKADEERRNRLNAARRKHARRLASMHYKMTLQKRIFLQWRRGLQNMIVFNDRKAQLAWNDRMHER
eukprot:scaffold1657_cov182-Alexandrium_tamarense.AAC.4